MYQEKEKELRSSCLKRKEVKLKNEYLHNINMTNEGTLKEQLYEIFKDEVDIINNNLL